ncbi:hypothetical protein BU26DRAFT_516679 [Trematosphaeria pertusa]|uniref:Uncharacterized protein n=1 Tax=Trematosphaeria pertusa TaxID=390896 RepID=A0A6A6IQV1_9PLEO|nr:uncharacterized protein BU26DRAFT_516679 [Trematosphaeria pertusa]KAF2251960.1 hypothetical protein BU26DRAFT_516679 [Trematosphaeria pertusa]
MTPHAEKDAVEQVEQAQSSTDSTALGERGFVGEANELPKGYFYSPFFIGTTCAIGMNLMVSSFALLDLT